LLVSVIVAIGIKIVGTLLVGFLVIVPAAAAKNLSSDLFRYSIFSAVFGAISSFSGVLLSSYLGLPSGPLVVISGITVFAATVLARWKAK
jgi:zinc transport system permease protein